MDKSKGEPVISVKTSTTSKDRVSDASAWETFSLETDPESCQATCDPHLILPVSLIRVFITWF